MRKSGLVLLSLLLVSATLSGCFGKEDQPGATDPTPTSPSPSPTPGAPTPSTPTGGTPSTPTPTTSPSPTPSPPPPAKKPPPIHENKTIALSPGLTAQPSTGSATLTVPAVGWKTFHVKATGHGPSGAPFLANKVSISIQDPSQTEVAKLELTGPGETAMKEGDVPAGGAAGDYTFVATGDNNGPVEILLTIDVEY